MCLCWEEVWYVHSCGRKMTQSQQNTSLAHRITLTHTDTKDLLHDDTTRQLVASFSVFSLPNFRTKAAKCVASSNKDVASPPSSPTSCRVSLFPFAFFLTRMNVRLPLSLSLSLSLFFLFFLFFHWPFSPSTICHFEKVLSLLEEQ